MRSSIGRYLVAFGLVAVATMIKLRSFPGEIGREGPFLLLNGAVALAAWFGGRGPALAATALAVAAADFFFLPPYGSFALTRTTAAQLGIFITESCAVAALTIAMKEARARAERAAERSRRTEEDLRTLNRAHRALSTANQILVHAGQEEGLLQDVCRVIVEVAGYRMCWVGRAEHDEAKTVRPLAAAGHEAGYLKTVNITWADSPRGRGPTGTAVRTGQPSVHQDIAKSPTFAPWCEDSQRRGYASVIALPLRIDDRVFGALTIYASERDAFNEAAMRLLIELSTDLAYGIASLRARAEASQANRAKDEFLRVASHELRTPLTPIIGWAQLLKRNQGRDPAQIERGLDVILRSARAEARLVEDLIDVSSIAAGELSMDPKPVDLGPVVQACVDEARPSAAAKGVELEASIGPDTRLAGDARRLQQAARNLLSNALKFTPRGGRVSVALTRACDALLLTVRDTGKGIPAGELAHVFEPLRPGDASTTRTEPGLGLGLAIVRYIVEAHGGTVHVESEGLGHGATLSVKLPGLVELPACPARPPAPAESRSPP